MFRRFSANFAVFSIFLDIILISLSLWVSVLAREPLNRLSFARPVEGGPYQVEWILYILFPLTWVSVLAIFSVYDGRRNLKFANEFGSLVRGSMLGLIAIAGVLYLSFRETSRLLFLVTGGLGFLLIFSWRSIFRLATRWNILGKQQRRKILVLGAGSTGRKVLDAIIEQRDLGMRLLGFLDDNPQKQKDMPDVLGSLDQAREVICENHVDDVVVALPASAHVRLNEVVSDLHDLPVRVWVIPDYFSLTLHRASVEDFAGIPMLDIRAPALSEYQRMTKRAFDLFVCLCGMPFVLPIVGVIAAAIRLDSPGSVFYSPERIGENGRIFKMIKFRSMVANADKIAHQVQTTDEKGRMVHKVRNDPRVTRLGAILRRTSMDELPNIFNVLRGEMSLVGPRPEMPWLVEKYEPWQRKRFAVPQGITGWWQVNGRSDRPMHLNTEDDLYYVQHYSIWLDILILLRTFSTVIRGKGAF
jgi:exopolysaccharide biosynthesis polyprenyl glycosylphosphotransferase